ncbi:54S ribosomal protein L3, variant 2 [Schistosoma haematobium]|nr:54S ribosomal protein L3, variant 2 [Schistosoma haematobium]KAH9581474.1 54S ribosomal protein L3, variant 2 [Schistosoma haematobium]
MFEVFGGAFIRMTVKLTYREPVRFMGSLNKVLYPWMNRKKPFWVTQEASPYVDEDITSENKTFLEQQRIDSLTSSTSPVVTEQPAQVPWKPYVTQRCGLIAIKLGLYPLWTKTGKKIDCTIFQIPDNHAIRYTPPSEINKYISLLHPRHYWLNNKRPPSWITQKRWGIQLVGAVSADPIEFTSEWCDLFKKAGIPPKRKISRFLVSPDAALKPGTPLSVHHFRVGDRLDITART